MAARAERVLTKLEREGRGTLAPEEGGTHFSFTRSGKARHVAGKERHVIGHIGEGRILVARARHPSQDLTSPALFPLTFLLSTNLPFPIGSSFTKASDSLTVKQCESCFVGDKTGTEQLGLKCSCFNTVPERTIACLCRRAPAASN